MIAHNGITVTLNVWMMNEWCETLSHAIKPWELYDWHDQRKWTKYVISQFDNFPQLHKNIFMKQRKNIYNEGHTTFIV